MIVKYRALCSGVCQVYFAPTSLNNVLEDEGLHAGKFTTMSLAWPRKHPFKVPFSQDTHTEVNLLGCASIGDADNKRTGGNGGGDAGMGLRWTTRSSEHEDGDPSPASDNE